jgi:hypothetical protein
MSEQSHEHFASSLGESLVIYALVTESSQENGPTRSIQGGILRRLHPVAGVSGVIYLTEISPS